MSFLEGPKNRFATCAPVLTAALNSTQVSTPGCVQCGSLLDITDRKNASFSGKCVSCEYWISDEDENEQDDLE